jgi:RHS repeat-associated protein
MLYSRHRYLQSSTAAFLARDPLQWGNDDLLDEASELMLPPYAYAAGNPVRYADPMGLIFNQIISAGAAFAISMMSDWSLMWLSLALRDAAIKNGAGECPPCRTAEVDAYRRVWTGSGLLNYRWPKYMQYAERQAADYRHWGNILNDSKALMGDAVIMLRVCRTWGYRSLAGFYFFLSQLEPPYPNLP